MCTSIIHNGNKTIVGWNLDLLDMQHKIVVEEDKVYIAIFNKDNGWIPLFGANDNGNFVAMPTCWPYDKRSDPIDRNSIGLISLNIDLLFKKKSLEDIKDIVEEENIYSEPGVTFQSQLTDKNGNVLQITPGQGNRYIIKPRYSVMTNFSPFKGSLETHPWMGLDRYNTCCKILENAAEDFDVKDCFKLLKKSSQTVCPTVVSMVFDVTNNTIYWCENRKWNKINHKTFSPIN